MQLYLLYKTKESQRKGLRNQITKDVMIYISSHRHEKTQKIYRHDSFTHAIHLVTSHLVTIDSSEQCRPQHHRRTPILVQVIVYTR